jgi:hypothetical protein
MVDYFHADLVVGLAVQADVNVAGQAAAQLLAQVEVVFA